MNLLDPKSDDWDWINAMLKERRDDGLCGGFRMPHNKRVLVDVDLHGEQRPTTVMCMTCGKVFWARQIGPRGDETC